MALPQGIELQAPRACPACGQAWRVEKTRHRTRLVTLQGEAALTLTSLACDRHDPPARWTPSILAAVALPGRQVTFDIMAAVGLLRYGCALRVDKVQAELVAQRIHLSQAELSLLSDEFLVRHRLWFESDRPRWAPWVQRGLVLMVDGTSDAGGPVTFRVVDARRGLTLHAAHIRSENLEDVTRVLADVKRVFGTPRCIIRDLSPTIRAACDAVFAGVPQQECHVHFLRDAGDALLRTAYEALKRVLLDSKRLARLKELGKALAAVAPDADPVRRGVRVWTRLLLEHVEAARDDAGGFPFRLAYHEVAQRVRDARIRIRDVVAALVRLNRCEALVLEAKEQLDAFGEDERARTLFLRVDRLRSWFEEVRLLMRLERATLQSRMRISALTRADRDAILVRVHAIRGEAAQAGGEEATAWQRMVDHFTAHEDHLWVTVRAKGHQRTTNPIEGAHREDRRGIRRRTGRHATGPEMERTGDHLALLRNLRNPWFVKHVLPGVDLVGAFRAQDPGRVREGVMALRRRRWRQRLPVRAPQRAGLLDEFLRILTESADPARITAWADRVEGAIATAV